ncbi:MAG: phosphate acyltransferase PlsX [Oligoflexia bacterium]|nr:phosphate acyltransferase PlsX [Oligoflexia bacterium]
MDTYTAGKGTPKRPLPVALDAMGGDKAPAALVAGALLAVRGGTPVVLVGDRDVLGPLVPPGVDLPIHHCETAVAMDDSSPVAAVRSDREPSISVAVRLVAQGQASAAVSCGHTGAVMAAGLLRLGRLPMVERPAIMLVVPRIDGGTLVILDLGANVDCRPSQLVQFAVMGHAFAHALIGLPVPRVGLLSNGEEPGKGEQRVRDAGRLLAELPLNFVGNVEPTAAFKGACDVLVCDGFVGNVMLKTVEATAEVVGHILREEILRHPSAKAGAWLLRPALRRVRERTDYASQGGALLLGVKGVVVVGHGRSDAAAVRSAVVYAARCAAERVPERITQALSSLCQP